MTNVTTRRNCILSNRSGKTVMKSRGMMPPQKNTAADDDASPTHLLQALPLRPLARKEDDAALSMDKLKSHIERRRLTGMSPGMAMKDATSMAPFKALTNRGILSTGSFLCISIMLKKKEGHNDEIRSSHANHKTRM